MDIYEEIHLRRAERFAKRQARIQREMRRALAMAWLKELGQAALGAIILLACLFAGALWIGM